MIFNYNNKKETFEKFDICIIGTGIAASSLAIELLNSKFSFVMIEAGSLDGNANKLIQNEICGREFEARLDDLNSKNTTSIEVGGTSSLWHGVLAPLDEIDFQKRVWINNSGWPINYDDLKPYYLKACKILKLFNYEFFNIKKLPHKLYKILTSINFNQNILDNKIFQRPMPVTRFKKILLSKLKESKNQHLIFNAAALECVHSESGSVQKIICGSEDGEKFSIFAKKFVVCAGALETPRILLNSKINNNNIGKYLMDHPMGSICQIQFNKKQKPDLFNYYHYSNELMIKFGFTFTADIQKKFQLPNHCFYTKASFIRGINFNSEKVLLSLLDLRHGKISLKNILNVLMHPLLVCSFIAEKLRLNVKYADLLFISEQLPNPESKITLSDKTDNFGYPIARIDWNVSKKDSQSIYNSINALQSHILNIKDINFVKEKINLNWSKVFRSASHHLGTARMSDTDETGVVDRNLKVFNFDNLFICDGSVFPTSGNANCSLTISALACRLADYLKITK